MRGEQLSLGFLAGEEPAQTERAPDLRPLGPGAALLYGFALPQAERLVADLLEVAERAPFRHLTTPGGREMSVAMTNCGPFGWASDARGYRYARVDPREGLPWPPIPASFQALAAAAAERVGFPGFRPDACLINRYAPGAKLSLHQDRDEADLSAPIVSVSLGLPAVFLWGGLARSDRSERLLLTHGDVVVWGGPARLRFHGVLPLAAGRHALTGGLRFNLTFRRASACSGSGLGEG